jgi:hypothetical protein
MPLHIALRDAKGRGSRQSRAASVAMSRDGLPGLAGVRAAPHRLFAIVIQREAGRDV